jgi:TFIIF-interacting CTD phosphatase-like protein
MPVTRIYTVPSDRIPPTSISKNKVIVLDLDSTLVCTQKKMSDLYDLGILKDPELLPIRQRTYIIDIENLNSQSNLSRGSGTINSMWGVTRPGLKRFLIFCFSYFRMVVVWSAGRKSYVEAIIDEIFKDIRRPSPVFTYNDLDTLKGKYDPTKRLKKLYTRHPEYAEYLNERNTLIIDDNPLTFVENPDNAVEIPDYSPEPTISSLGQEDHALLQLQYWFLQKTVVNAPDVRLLDKSKIFSTSVSAYETQLSGMMSNLRFD